MSRQAEFLARHLTDQRLRARVGRGARRRAVPLEARARSASRPARATSAPRCSRSPPGAATFPLHAHFANEELLVVLSGRPTLTHARRASANWRRGEVVAFPAGLDGAHRLDNRSDEPVRVLIVSTMRAPEINAMLEDGQYWLRDYVPGTDAARRRARRLDQARLTPVESRLRPAVQCVAGGACRIASRAGQSQQRREPDETRAIAGVALVCALGAVAAPAQPRPSWTWRRSTGRRPSS